MSREHQSFRKGDRVRLSADGQRRFAKVQSTIGMVVGFGLSASSIRVLFDGRVEPVSLHERYLERDEAQRPDSRLVR